MEIDHRFTDTVICPYCGWDNGGNDGDGPPSGPQQCYECEKHFFCEPNYSVDYCTSKLDCANNLAPHRWSDSPWKSHDDQWIYRCHDCDKCEKHPTAPQEPRE